MQIWRINLRHQTLVREEPPESWQRLGGRGLLAKILCDEVDPTCDPLGSGNKLVFAPGLLVGHMLSSCDRISIGAKSPLTRGIKEANAGGSTGLKIAHLGIKAVILEDCPVAPEWYVLHVSREGVRFDHADYLAGVGVYAAARILRDAYGKEAAISLIGPGGEMLLASAGVQNLDQDDVPSRIAARGGIGAVMGSKHIKAIVWDAAGGEKPPIADAPAYRRAQKLFSKTLVEQKLVQSWRDFGTAGMTMLSNSFGALPVRSFSRGNWEEAEKISGENMRETILRRGGKGTPTHACMAGCAIRCSNVFAGEDGEEIVSPLEYETIGLMGSNLGLSDLDVIAHLNWIANDLGLDTIEIGAALGVAAEAGQAAFGDADSMLRLLEEIRQGTELGRVIGNGAASAGRAFGVERVPVVKGQAISAYDPRAIKGTGVTYATSPQGADHTSGLTIRAKVDHLDPKGQADLSRATQINMAGYDTLGACIFSGPGFAAAPEAIRDLINARYGWAVGVDFLQVLGRETLRLERAFNRRAGFTAADDRLPEWMKREPVAPTNSVFDVPDSDLDGVFNE
jgi:aldehyde:ferredoxin oxidoreductase